MDVGVCQSESEQEVEHSLEPIRFSSKLVDVLGDLGLTGYSVGYRASMELLVLGPTERDNVQTSESGFH